MNSELRIGIAGLGTVGSSVVRLIERQSQTLSRSTGRMLRLVAVSARDKTRDRGFALDGLEWFDDPVVMAQSPQLDVFVELMGGDEGSARLAVEAALQAGKSVVTANKALLAKHGAALAALAEKKFGCAQL